MKLQPASKKEVKRMTVGCSICATAEIIGLLVLSLFGIGHFSSQMILGAVGGTLVAIGNFTLMCLMIQNAAGTKDEKLLRAKVQSSYNFRLFVQAGWILAAFLIPQINVISAAIPLLFPTVVIYYLQMTGKLMPKEEQCASASSVKPAEAVDEDIEDNLNSFEI